MIVLRRLASFVPALAAMLLGGTGGATAAERSPAPPPDGTTIKAVLDTARTGENLLKPDAWRPYEQGFQREGKLFVCDNGSDSKGRRGAAQSVELNQARPEPIVASAWSKAEGVTGSSDNNYSVYLDLVYDDGTSLWGQTANFEAGTHDFQRRQVVLLPEKPVKRLTFYTLLRGHAGKALFRDPELRVVKAPDGACVFDGVPVVMRHAPVAGFQVRDVAAGSDFVRIGKEALGLKLDLKVTTVPSAGREAGIVDVTLSDTTGKDRAVTLVYAVPVPPQASSAGEAKLQKTLWLEDPRRTVEVLPGREHVRAGHFRAGSNGRLSLYPLGAVTHGDGLSGVGIDMSYPAFFRIGLNSGTGEFYLAYDVGLAPEKPLARLRFCTFSFDAAWGFRGALAKYYELFPEQFRSRTPEQGLWMPFAKISRVKGWEDFGFKFKEGNDETAWDDAHGIITFRYTEPMTWWMSMPKEMPRTMEAALAEARRLAEKGNPSAKALLASGYHDPSGRFPAMLLDTPWCNGAVWSMNSMPGIPGEFTDFKNKWNPKLREQLYGPKRRGDLDGEYVDSSEGYVTRELDFRREHFAAAQTPLVFSQDTHKPAIFRGLVAFEYVRGIAADVHGMGKLMMANGAPDRLCWLIPLVDVGGTETNWNPGGRWRPMSDEDLLYRRALCKGKPYCFLMNSEFEKFSNDLVEKYMKRSLAYGMFPGFFSHNASQGHYFTRAELYDRDRPLFKKYVPLCKRVAEAGWEPITLARSSDPKVYVERFGAGSRWYLTVFNDSPQRRTATITLTEGKAPTSSRELVSGRAVTWEHLRTAIALEGEDVAVIELTDRPDAVGETQKVEARQPGTATAGAADANALFAGFVKQPSKQSYLGVLAALASSEAYQPYANDLADIEELIERKQFKEAQARLDKARPGLLLSPRLHSLAARTATGLGDAGTMAAELSMGNECLKAILGTGDGSRERPYVVSMVEDEYDLLRHLKKRVRSQGLMIGDEKHYDRIQCQDGGEVWFDITTPFKTLGRKAR